jgi:hypothetical protein
MLRARASLQAYRYTVDSAPVTMNALATNASEENVTMLKRIALSTAAIGAAAAMSLTAGASPAQAATQADTFAGCEEGYVCIYPDATWNHDPILKFYTYGAHNLNDVYGYKRIFNNQSGGAKAQTCLGYNGTDCSGDIDSWSYVDRDFTPINSVRLHQ